MNQYNHFLLKVKVARHTNILLYILLNEISPTIIILKKNCILNRNRKARFCFIQYILELKMSSQLVHYTRIYKINFIACLIKHILMKMKKINWRYLLNLIKSTNELSVALYYCNKIIFQQTNWNEIVKFKKNSSI